LAFAEGLLFLNEKMILKIFDKNSKKA